ncbi:MAG: hypothetical protein ABSF54_08560 [Bryobacteraceae bacterium]|jgi:hypothetical protein
MTALSYGFRMQRFGGNRQTPGRTLILDGPPGVSLAQAKPDMELTSPLLSGPIPE